MQFVDILSQEDLNRLHQEALRVLEHVGCIVDHPQARELLQARGAQVDDAAKRVNIPEQLVTADLQTVPATYLAAGRVPATSYRVKAGMPARLRCLGGALTYFSMCENQSRRITLADAERMLALADGLPQIDLVGTPYVHEFPAKTYDVHSLRLALSRTVKHIWSLTIDSRNLRYQMELLEATCGGRQRLKTHKRLSGIVCIIDPLKFPHDEIERLKVYGEYRVPIKWTSSSMIGGNAPYTLSAALVQNMAQLLAAVVITVTLAPETSLVYYATLQLMDMQTGQALFASPELMLAKAAVAQAARFYGFASAITCINSNASTTAQAVYERYTELFSCLMAGAGEINLAGALNGGAFFCPEFAVLDDEWMARLRFFGKGVAIGEHQADMSLYSRGIRSGEYVSDPHTLANLRTEGRFNSDLFDHHSREDGIETDSASLLKKAWEKARQITSTHETPALEDTLEKELDDIVAAADRELLT